MLGTVGKEVAVFFHSASKKELTLENQPAEIRNRENFAFLPILA
jgi:hypothetical protein